MYVPTKEMSLLSEVGEALAFVNGLRLAACHSPHKGTMHSKLISSRRKQGHTEESKLTSPTE